MVQFKLPECSRLAQKGSESWVKQYNFHEFFKSSFGVQFEYYQVNNYLETYCLTNKSTIGVVDGHLMGKLIAYYEESDILMSNMTYRKKEINYEYFYLKLFKFFSILNKNFHFALRASLLLESKQYKNKKLKDLTHEKLEENLNKTSLNYFINISFPVFHELGHWLIEKTNAYRGFLDIITEETCINFICKSLDYPANNYDYRHRNTVINNLNNKDFILNLENVKNELAADVAGTMLMFDFLTTIPEFNICNSEEGLKNTAYAIEQLLHFTYKFYLLNGLYSDSKVFLINPLKGNSLDYYRSHVYSPILLEARKFALITAMTHKIALDIGMDSDLVFNKYINKIYGTQFYLTNAFKAFKTIRTAVFYERSSNYDIFERNVLGGRKNSENETSLLIMEYFEEKILSSKIWPNISTKDIDIKEIW